MAWEDEKEDVSMMLFMALCWVGFIVACGVVGRVVLWFIGMGTP